VALFEAARANPGVPLQDLNGFVEVDLSLIIKAYEEGMVKSETEEGVLIANYGELEKQRGAMEMSDSIMRNFNKSGSINTDSESPGQIGPAIVDIGDNPFGDCFPCDGRITFGIDNLPHPALFNIFDNLMASIENFIQQMKNIMDPTNFYSDICRLLDALRIVCPQDLLILLALLRFLLSYYIMLSFQLNLDWVSILGMILLPILLLIHALLQMAVNIGLGPLQCLIDLLVFASDLAVSIEATAVTAVNAVDTSVQSFADAGRQVAGLVDPNETSPIVPTQAEVEVLAAEPPGPSVPIPPDGGYRKYQELIGKLNGFTSMLVAMTDIRFTLQQLIARFTNAIEAIIRLLSAGMILKMQFAAAIADILRLIGFIIALIKGLQNNSICDDPTVPLSAQDVQSLIQILNESRELEAEGTATTSSSDTVPLISSTIGLDFDTATGELIVTDKITDQSKRVPACINTATSDDRATIEQWIAELESSSV
jgi:hypothetical protein